MAHSCIIGGFSSIIWPSRNTTYYGKQSKVFLRSSFRGSFAKVKGMNESAPIVYKSTTMAQQQSYGSSSNLVEVIGSKYCMQYPIDLAVVKKIANIIYSDYVVSHKVDKTINFYVRRDSNSFHEDFVLHDYATNEEPIVTIRKKIFTTHERWQVYRGHNTDDQNLLFSIKKSSTKHSSATNVALDVYLSYNIIEDVCDFKITQNWLSKNTFEVYMGDNIIAQIQKKDIVENILFEKEKLMLYVYRPYVDYAFIVALGVIVNQMDCLEDRKTLPSILAYQLFQRPVKFMARLLGVLMVPTKYLARLLCAYGSNQVPASIIM